MIISDILNSAARKLGLIASNETLTTFEYENALTILKAMLKSWSSVMINSNSTVRENFTLTSGKLDYTWGVGGDFDSERPYKLITASVTILGTSTSVPVDIISEEEYERITNKLKSGTPTTVFVQYSYPHVVLRFYPVPSSDDTLYLYSLKPFTEAGSFSALNDELQLPDNYLEPIITNLAIRMATEFGVTSPPELINVAQESYTSLVNLNSSNYIEPVKVEIPIIGNTGRPNTSSVR